MISQNKKSIEGYIIIKIFIAFIGLTLLLINLAYENVSSFVSVYAVLIIILLIIKSRNSQPLLLFYFFLLSYSILPVFFFLFENTISAYPSFQTYHHFSRTLNYQFLFILTIYFFSKNNYNPDFKKLIDFKIRDNLFLFIISILLIWFIILWGKTGTNIFSAGGYGQTSASGLGGTAIWEYSFLFFIVAFYFSGLKSIRTKVVFFTAISFMFKDLALGGRVATLQLIILIFILYYENSNRTAKLIGYVTIGFFAMVLFGELRGNLHLTIGDILSKFGDPYRFLSNQGEVFYSGTLIVELTRVEFVDLSFRIKSFIGNVISIFFPSKFTFEEAQVPWIASRNLGGMGGGGMISSYFYFWGGAIAVIAIGAYVSLLLNNAYRTKNIYVKFYIIMVIVTVSRWYSYSPITLFKSTFYIIPVLFLFILIHNYKYKT
ncbi:hypothetical protein [Salipaludibacillus sp. CF4.18]|uniref:hypothetical protein n=1 Tax=Salipaludibacillus sp. CF4.18 TaxID=3373081 RepID=UPI003EE6E58E